MTPNAPNHVRASRADDIEFVRDVRWFHRGYQEPDGRVVCLTCNANWPCEVYRVAEAALRLAENRYA